ncbi:MAG TPA: 16S rRNA (adenine(1518)-N(6)/adenine(1519)-N(6))-dimethyltransferase RsmA [Chitinispirillaceae bacterium]|jgi:16S rRNA (adenine1518-N6/adenine1519-N6)-dimethyltransferase|nr:16S rRNA (adenine(1518)-N(6)/adenine(1519)-N(6))-dimethyltransferase RsmA [Chitinispirillaceae bacterium]
MRPKKHLGQHFLTSTRYAERIAESVPAGSGENVLEIGPGQGALSVYLKKRFPDFHLVEVDPEAVERLREKLGEGRHVIHNQDIMEFDYSTAGFPLHVVGNLPYSIAALILKKTLYYGNDILSCTFMVQREVAERIASGPHSKTNGFLTIFCAFFGTPRILFHVPPGAFFPRPNVDSTVFQIIIDEDLETKLERDNWESFFAFVSRGFSQRRKTLAKVLGDDQISKQDYHRIFVESGIDPLSRPEDLDVNLWLKLFRKSLSLKKEPV